MADITFNTDLTGIVESVLNNIEGRNDLAIVIQNGLNWQLTANFNALSGSYASSWGNNVLSAITIPSDNSSVAASIYGMGFDSKGEGCYIQVYVAAPNCAWAFAFDTRPNKTNQFHVMAWDWVPAQQDAYNSVSNSTAISANSGVYTDSTTIPGVTLSVSMTTEGGTAATAEINFAMT